MKRCGRCEIEKPREDFSWRNKKKGTLQGWCKTCHVEYRMDRYYENREEEIKYRKQNYEVNRDFVRDLKRKPCTDCGGSFHFSAMDFDHTEDDKRKDVSKILKGSRDTLLAEIAKCELVCANCHRVRTWQRTQK